MPRYSSSCASDCDAGRTQTDSVEMLHILPSLAFELLVQQHLSDLDVKTLRLVNKECRPLIDTALKSRCFKKSQVIMACLP